MADFYVTQVRFQTDLPIIESVIVYPATGTQLGECRELTRRQIIEQMQLGKTFSTMTKTVHGNWAALTSIYLYGGRFLKTTLSSTLEDDLGNIPLLAARRKTFLSYYHKDQEYRNQYENLMQNLIINKSVRKGDIDSDNSDVYTKQLIQQGYLQDTTVLIVLIGPRTKCRKHVDWEISAALNYKVGDRYAGILGVLLPTHPDYNKGIFLYSNLPVRLAENVESGYAVLVDWTTERKHMQEFIELAFQHRGTSSGQRKNSLLQMQQDTCD